MTEQEPDREPQQSALDYLADRVRDRLIERGDLAPRIDDRWQRVTWWLSGAATALLAGLAYALYVWEVIG